LPGLVTLLEGHNTGSIKADSTTAPAATPVTLRITGSDEIRNAEARALLKDTLAESIERKLAASAVLTLKLRVAEGPCSRWRRPTTGESVTAVTVTVVTDTLSVMAMDEDKVVFCAMPKLEADSPARVRLDANVVCKELAKPGGLTVHARAPAAGE
jgi:hypothetical protein